MEINRNTIAVLKAWGEIAKERLADSVEKHRVTDTHALMASIDVAAATDQVHISYNYYGMFVDMGVGKGVKLGDVRFNAEQKRAGIGGSRRKPKKWYSKTIFREVAKLGDILASHFGIMGAGAVLSEHRSRMGGTLGAKLELDA